MPSLLTDDERERMLQDTGGVPVVYHGQSTWGRFREPGVLLEGGHGAFVTDSPTVLVVTGKLAELLEDEPIEVDGNGYVIREPMKEQSGALTRLALREPF